MDSKADTIRRRMSEVRREIDDDFGDLVEGAESLVDWRVYVRNHPFAATTVACAVGYLLIPKRDPVINVDEAALTRLLNGKNLLHQDRLTDGPAATVTPKRPLVSALLTTLAGVVVRSTATRIGQQLTAAITNNGQRGPDENHMENVMKPHHMPVD